MIERVAAILGISPARVVASADLNGGANDFEEFYCPAIEWDWGDDTKSTTSADCDPYEAGKSEIGQILRESHRLSNGAPDDFTIRDQTQIAATASSMPVASSPSALRTAATRRISSSSARPKSWSSVNVPVRRPKASEP